MRKNSSKSSHQDDDYFPGNLQEMSDDDFFDAYKRDSRRKRDERRLRARRKLERYKEEKELARWLDDSHLEF